MGCSLLRAAVASLAVSSRRIAAANDDAREAAAFLLDHALVRLEDRIGSSAERRKLAEQLLPRIERLERQSRRGDEAWVRSSRARVLGVLGDVAQDERRLVDALGLLQRALESRRLASEAEPQDRHRLADVSIALVRVGDVMGDLAREREQREHYERAMEIDRRLAAQAPSDVRLASNLAYSCERLSALAVRGGDSAGGLRLAREQLAIASGLLERDPDNSARIWDVLSARGTFDAALHAAGERAEFEASGDASLAMLRRLAEMEPFSRRVAVRRASVLHRRADDLRSTNFNEALACNRRAESVARELERNDPNDWEPRAWVLRIILGRMAIQSTAGRVNSGLENATSARQALKALEQVHSRGRETALLRRDTAHGVAAALGAAGLDADADAFVREVLQSMLAAAETTSQGGAAAADPAWEAEERELILQTLLVLRRPTDEERGRAEAMLREMLERDDPRSLVRAAAMQLEAGDRAGASRTADRALRRCAPEQTMFAEEAGRLKRLCEGG